MEALLTLCKQLMEKSLLTDSQMSDVLTEVICKCFRQAAERIAKIREVAARTIMDLLRYQVQYVHVAERHPLSIQCMQTNLQAQHQPRAEVHARDRVCAMLHHIQNKGHLGNVRGIPHVIAMISIPQYRTPILMGAVASIGGIDQNLSQAAADALTAVVTTDEDDFMNVHSSADGAIIKWTHDLFNFPSSPMVL